MSGTHELGDLRSLAEGDIWCVAEAGPYGVVVCRVDGDLWAVDDNCPLCDQPLNGGVLTAHRLRCPAHEDWFDIRDGSPNSSTSGDSPPTGLACHTIDGPEHAIRLHVQDDGAIGHRANG